VRNAVPRTPDEDRRTLAERRHAPTSLWDTLAGIGRRLRHRRAHDHAQAYFVDRFTPPLFAILLTLLVLSLIDAVITIQLLSIGCDEVNPLMARLVEWGVLPFLMGKYLLTAAGLPFLLTFKNFKLFGTPFRVGYLFATFVAMYLALIAYQLTLFR
jgi:Domain of unknown function (DUF5658)